ncbi:hypothetical protein RUM43_006468 [Polyplax serrata]|uniref:Uncharacterized protein n=1 Tax=Polyplax serrata TaxID=468196 RepID=A0AAN8NS49_POLSC
MADVYGVIKMERWPEFAKMATAIVGLNRMRNDDKYNKGEDKIVKFLTDGKEKTGLIVPWVIGFIALMALEGVSVVYSNVLRDHVNKKIKDLFLPLYDIN